MATFMVQNHAGGRTAMIGSNYPGGGILMDPNGEVTSLAGSLPSEVGGHDGGAMFDQYMRRACDQAFPFSPERPASRTTDVWAGRRMRVLPTVDGVWIEGRIAPQAGLKQWNTGRYCIRLN